MDIEELLNEYLTDVARDLEESLEAFEKGGIEELLRRRGAAGWEYRVTRSAAEAAKIFRETRDIAVGIPQDNILSYVLKRGREVARIIYEKLRRDFHWNRVPKYLQLICSLYAFLEVGKEAIGYDTLKKIVKEIGITYGYAKKILRILSKYWLMCANGFFIMVSSALYHDPRVHLPESEKPYNISPTPLAPCRPTFIPYSSAERAVEKQAY